MTTDWLHYLYTVIRLYLPIPALHGLIFFLSLSLSQSSKVSKYVLTEIQKDHHAAQLEQLLPMDDEEGEENESGEARSGQKVESQAGNSVAGLYLQYFVFCSIL